MAMKPLPLRPPPKPRALATLTPRVAVPCLSRAPAPPSRPSVPAPPVRAPMPPASEPSLEIEITFDPDGAYEGNPEDWVTFIDAEPFALAHGGVGTLFSVLDDLVSRMRDLPCCETTAEAASLCLAAALVALPSQLGLAHVYDARAGHFVVVHGQGAGAEQLLMTTTTEGDLLFASAMAHGAPFSFHYDGQTPHPRPPRRHTIGGTARSVLTAPAIEAGRCLGVIELVDPTDGSYFDVRAENMLAYVARHFSEFLAQHGTEFGHLVSPGQMLGHAGLGGKSAHTPREGVAARD